VSAAVARARRLSVPAMTDLLGTSPAMAEVRRGVERAARAPFAVLIEGESGSGKELVARALHRSACFARWSNPPSQTQGSAVMAIAIGYQAGAIPLGIVAIAPRVLVTKPMIPRIMTYRMRGSGANAAVT
jgi:hypothetical protein